MTRVVRYLREGRLRLAAETADGVFAEVVETSMLEVLTTGGTPSGETLAVADAAAPQLEGVVLALPLDAPEVWCAGVTYERSREARHSEATYKDVYTAVYEADRPELFLKDAMGRRTVGPGRPIGVRADSSWDVPEPEIGLVLGEEGRIVGVTIGNDVSSREIEGENPLYLPQAKVYAGACALGPAVYVPGSPDETFEISLRILDASGAVAFEGATSTRLMRRGFEDLVGWLLRDNPVPPGSVLLTGTGLVPPDSFTLRPGHVVEIHVPQIGTLVNPVVAASTLR